MKTQEELIALANEYKGLNDRLKELSEEELQQVTGGDLIIGKFIPHCEEIINDNP